MQLPFGREPEPPEGEPLDLDKDGLDITNYMADRLVKQKAGYKAWIEAEAENRVARATNMRTRRRPT